MNSTQSKIFPNGKGDLLPDSIESVENWLINRIAEELDLDPFEIEIDQPLTTYGIDSMDAVVIAGDLEEWINMELPSTLVWDYPTVTKIARYIFKKLVPSK